jgi:hypothetical protein
MAKDAIYCTFIKIFECLIAMFSITLIINQHSVRITALWVNRGRAFFNS